MKRQPSCWSEIFFESWIYESPQRLNQPSLYDQLVYNITEFAKFMPSNIVNLGDGWFKYNGTSRFFYWYSEKNTIIMGAELDLQSHALVVSLVAKNESFKGKPPFRSDLYSCAVKPRPEGRGYKAL